MTAKALSMNDIRGRCSQFVVDWRDEPGDERQHGQSFVRDLLKVFGITATKAALYEKRAQRTSTGNQGYIDALVPGLCLIEMKSAGKDLVAAERQALDYVDDLPDVETPRWIITSDFFNFRVLHLAADDGADTETFTLEELPAHAETLAFLAGYQTRSFGDRQQEQASIKAAQLMASLYEALEGSGYDEHEASVFLVRTLFALYADDSGVWERDLFYEFIETRTSADGSDLGGQLSMLYQVMNKPIDKRQTHTEEILLRFPYVNGHIFGEAISIPAFDRSMRDLLIECCAFNWAEISPAIFGSLFQAVKDKEARRQLGEHYTTETNILKTIEPLVLDELREEFAAQAHNVNGLKKLRHRMGELRILDPACGCGNFLVVAYRELRKLDLQILQRLQDLGDQSEFTMVFVKENLPVTLDHFAGIEIEEWPARIADTALHLVDHQANQAMELAIGMAPEPLPLDKIQSIHVDNALRMDWADAMTPGTNVRVVGNPPFIGQYTQSVDQTADLKLVWGGQYDGYLDYVTGWYKKASDYFHYIRGGRFAFVSTNSITQGQPVPALFGPLFDAGWRIRFAHRTFTWASEAPGAAAVHCVIVGFDKREKTQPQLYTYKTPKSDPARIPAKHINAYLINAPNFFITKRSKPLSPVVPAVAYGSKPADGGNLLLDHDAYKTAMDDPHAAKYVRKFVGARELIQRTQRWCLWLENLDPHDVDRSHFLRERIEACKAFRVAAPKKGDAYKLRKTPHLFRPNAKVPATPYLCIPRHFSETRAYPTVAYFDPDIVCGDANFTAEDPAGYLFAIISSSMYLAWQRMVGGRIKSDLRFSATVVWNNLPLTRVNETTRQTIIDAGQDVIAARMNHPARSLADHYNPLAMDPKLIDAHEALDRLVDQAFGAKQRFTNEKERQETLFTQYAAMTKHE